MLNEIKYCYQMFKIYEIKYFMTFPFSSALKFGIYHVLTIIKESYY